MILAITYVILRATILNFSNSFNFYNENNAFTTHISIRLMTFFKAMVQYTPGFLFFPYQLRVEGEPFAWAQSTLGMGCHCRRYSGWYFMLYSAFNILENQAMGFFWNWMVFYCHCSRL